MSGRMGNAASDNESSLASTTSEPSMRLDPATLSSERSNGSAAVSSSSPCATYRPNHPDGLRPPQQLQFVFRQERRLQVAWAFPSASEQRALHAGV